MRAGINTPHTSIYQFYLNQRASIDYQIFGSLNRQKRKMKTYLPILLLPVLLFMTTGCIKESRDDCENLSLYFQYLADGDKDVLYQYMSKVDLYVFDVQENMVGHLSYDHKTMKNFSAFTTFRLQPGRIYTVVALGNAYEHTEVVNFNSNNLDQIYVQDVNWGSSKNVHTHDHNYMGSKVITMPDNEDIMVHDTVTLYSSHINVEVRITGDILQPDNTDTLPYTLSIEQSNPLINFYNDVVDDIDGTCSPTLIYDAESQCYCTDDLTLFRLDDGEDITPATCGHELVLRTAEGTELIRVSLYDYLQQHPEAKREALLQEANLEIELQFDGQDILIKVPDWEIEDTTPGWKN